MPLISKYIEFILGNGFSKDGDTPVILFLLVALKIIVLNMISYIYIL